MLKIVEIKIEQLQNMESMFQFIAKYYGLDKFVDVYLVSDGKQTSMVTRDGNECIYLTGDEKFNVYKFYLNDQNDLSVILKDDFQIELIDDRIILSKDGISSSIFFSYDEEEDLEGYNGRVIYNQYNSKDDINCELQFPHMYRLAADIDKPIIYDMHLRSFRTAYIDYSYRIKGEVSQGILGKRNEYFNKFIVMNTDPYYNVICFKEGLDYKSQPMELVRYCKTKFITDSGDYITLFPFCKTYTEEEVREHIGSLGFMVDVPELLVDVYNGKDRIVNDIVNLALQIKSIESKKQDTMRMTLKLKED